MQPRIRSASKFPPPWSLNSFPDEFAARLGAEIIAKLAVDRTGSIEGPEWERMFAVAIGAKWKPSNVGLDDIVLGDCAWGAKSAKAGAPFNATDIRLISGRNDPTYSYGRRPKKPDPLGTMVLGIWNERVAEVRKNYRHARTVVLIKPNKMTTEWLDFVAFEFETDQYDPKEFVWSWNAKKNLEAVRRGTDEHWFTWQPHGAQFTILHKVPEQRLRFQIKKPSAIDIDTVLKLVKFDKSWVRVLAST